MKLFCFVGAPASGKSRRANELFDQLKQNAVIIERDELREILTGKKRTHYRFTKANERLVTDAQVALIHKAVEAKRHIIISDTNFQDGTFQMLRGIAKDIGYEFVVVDMFTDFISSPHLSYLHDFSTRGQLEVYRSILIGRDLGREHTVGEKTIDRFIGIMEEYYGIVKASPNPELPRAIMVDIDGTLAHMHGRSPYDGTKMLTDTVDEHVLETINLYRNAGYKIIIVTGRHQLQVTIEWLKLHNIEYDDIFSRGEEDRRPDHIVKEEIYFNQIQPKYCAQLVLDDRGQVVRMWRSIGIKCYQVENTVV